MKALEKLLATIPPGKVSSSIGLDQALAASWDQFHGHAEGGMEAYKLLNRMENILWQPPILNFTLERHGG